jgi:hypothetical protein
MEKVYIMPENKKIPQESCIKLDEFDLIEEDICWLINNGYIRTKRNMKKIEKLLELLKWFKEKYIIEKKYNKNKYY